MQFVTPKEAYRISGLFDLGSGYRAADIAEYCERECAQTFDPTWARYRTMLAVYAAGRIDGIRAERERHKKEHDRRALCLERAVAK